MRVKLSAVLSIILTFGGIFLAQSQPQKSDSFICCNVKDHSKPHKCVNGTPCNGACDHKVCKHIPVAEDDHGGSVVQDDTPGVHPPTPAEKKKGMGTECRRKGDKNSVACKCQYRCGSNGELQEDTVNCMSKCKRSLCKCDHPCST